MAFGKGIKSNKSKAIVIIKSITKNYHLWTVFKTWILLRFLIDFQFILDGYWTLVTINLPKKSHQKFENLINIQVLSMNSGLKPVEFDTRIFQKCLRSISKKLYRVKPGQSNLSKLKIKKQISSLIKKSYRAEI